jgi:hypothetical protein
MPDQTVTVVAEDEFSANLKAKGLREPEVCREFGEKLAV